MRFVSTLLLAALAFSLNAHADVAPLKTPTTAVKSADSLASLEPSNNEWSTVVYLHGVSKQTGVGFGFQTPLLWETLGFRVDYNFDRLGVPGADPVTFSALDAGLKFQINQASNENMFVYLLENFDFYFPRDAETHGSTVGFETSLGVEFRHVARVWNAEEIEHAVFIELGMGACELRANDNRGANSIGDGLIARLGFRRFL